MRKNKMMRLASSLLVAVLITTSTISGTFAKYTTQDKASDAARVSKWGVELQVSGDLYGANYFDGTNGNKATAGNDYLSVKSSTVPTADNVVAPGTLNADGFSFFLKGTPEVKSNIDVTILGQNIFLAEGLYGVMVKVPDGKVTAANYPELQMNSELYVESGGVYSLAGGTFDPAEKYYTLEDDVELDLENDDNYDSAYYPVIYKLNGNTNTGTLTYKEDSLKTASEKILTAAYGSSVDTVMSSDNAYYSKTISKVYDVNTNFASTLKLDNTYLTWAWDFGDPLLKGDNASMTDKADTILGNLIAASTSKVVMLKGGVYKTIAIEEVSKTAEHEAYKIAKVDDVTVACLTTQFSIDVTVTQVD